jgi:hypothetical protein
MKVIKASRKLFIIQIMVYSDLLISTSTLIITIANRDAMNLFENTLNRLENRLQSMIEGSLSRLFQADNQDQSIARLLAAAMQAEIHSTAENHLVSPDRFMLFMPTKQAQVLLANPDFITELTQHLQQAAQEAGITFNVPPTIRIIPDEHIGEPQVVVEFSLLEENLQQTQSLHRGKPISNELPKAYLIINGMRFHLLTKTITNIGRDTQNDIVIDDPRISSIHCQLRSFRGRYLVFDLGSEGGTWIGDSEITQAILTPGDVISLGGVPLVFGLENLEEQSATREMK